MGALTKAFLEGMETDGTKVEVPAPEAEAQPEEAAAAPEPAPEPEPTPEPAAAPSQPAGDFEELELAGQRLAVRKGQGDTLKAILEGNRRAYEDRLRQAAQEHETRMRDATSLREKVDADRRSAETLKNHLQEILNKNPKLQEEYNSVNGTQIAMEQMRRDFEEKIGGLTQAREREDSAREFQYVINTVEGMKDIQLPKNKLFDSGELRQEAVSLAYARSQSGEDFTADLILDSYRKTHSRMLGKIKALGMDKVGYIAGKVAAAAVPLGIRGSAPKTVASKPKSGKGAIKAWAAGLMNDLKNGMEI